AAAVIGHRFWQTRFHGDPAALGRTVNLNGLPFTIVGITPAAFTGVEVGRVPDIYVPVTISDRLLPGRPRLPLTNSFWLDVMGRLGPDATMQHAEAEATVLYHQANSGATRQLPPNHPLVRFFAHMRVGLIDGSKGGGGLRQDFGKPLLILMSIVGMV